MNQDSYQSGKLYQLVQRAWYFDTSAIMEVAKLCAEADRRLSATEKKKLIKSLPFSVPTFSKLARIGQDRRLHVRDIQKLLPASYSTIYALGQLTDDELQAALTEGVLTTTLRRDELAHWLQERKRWSRLSEQVFRFDKWSLCRG